MVSPVSKPYGWAWKASAASSEDLRRCARFMRYELRGMVWLQGSDITKFAEQARAELYKARLEYRLLSC